jgi:hypothetical protein
MFSLVLVLAQLSIVLGLESVTSRE